LLALLAAAICVLLHQVAASRLKQKKPLRVLLWLPSLVGMQRVARSLGLMGAPCLAFGLIVRPSATAAAALLLCAAWLAANVHRRQNGVWLLLGTACAAATCLTNLL
jgi:hypothetical protein